MVQLVKPEPIRCPDCSSDPNLRHPRTLAEVVITPAGYDVWTVRRHRRVREDHDRHAGTWLQPEGTYRWRARPDEHLRCGRKHRGQQGSVTLDDATIGAALRRAGVPKDLPRIKLDPENPGVYPEQTESYAELVERQRPEPPDREPDESYAELVEREIEPEL